jgi:hypothetical protein
MAEISTEKLFGGFVMEQTNQEIWEEILRLVQVMRMQNHAVNKMTMAATKLEPLDHSCLPVDYVADAEILLTLLERLEQSGVRFG